MAKDNTRRTDHSGIKMGFVMALFAIALGALWVRAGWVQLHEGDTLALRASRQSLAAEWEYGARGRIFDRNGEMLATSVEAKSVFARPFEIENLDVACDVLSRDLKMPRTAVYKKLKSNRKFVWIKRQVTDREAGAVERAGLKGVRQTSEFSRIYPNGHLAGQVLGFVDIDGRGREGIEHVFDKRLSPGKAEFVVQRDATGHRLYIDAPRPRGGHQRQGRAADHRHPHPAQPPSRPWPPPSPSTTPARASSWWWTSSPATSWPWPTSRSSTRTPCAPPSRPIAGCGP